MRKYDNNTKENTTIALGFTNHDGFFSFKLGASNIKNGILYKKSILYY